MGPWDGYPDRASARRAAARALHPDRGGAASALPAALASIDAHFTAAPLDVRPRIRRTRPLRRLVRELGRRRPRRRRYFQI
jgi:hypothetical protein